MDEVADPLEVSVAELARRRRAGAVVLVDVREPWEYHDGHVPGARPLPMAAVPAALPELLATDGTVHLVCATGHRSLHAARWLVGHGVDAVSVAGGTVAWAAAGHDVSAGDDA